MTNQKKKSLKYCSIIVKRKYLDNREGKRFKKYLVFEVHQFHL